MILTKGKKDDQFLDMFRQHDFKMKKLPSPPFFFKVAWSVSTLAIESQKHPLLVEVYSSRAILLQTEPSLIPMFRLGFIWEISARFLRSKKGQRSWGRVLARNSRNEANIAKYKNFDFRAARLPRSRSEKLRSLEPSLPALSYEHIEHFTKDLEVRRDLRHRASPVKRTHVNRSFKSNQIKSNPLFRHVTPRSTKVLVKTCTCKNVLKRVRP